MCEVSFSLGYYGFFPFEFLALFLSHYFSYMIQSCSDVIN